MIWSSPEGLALLWKAYPAGCLAIRGVYTLGGWTCADVWENAEFSLASARFVRDSEQYVMPVGARLAGARIDSNFSEFLPHPNPADPATWHTMLDECGRALGGSFFDKHPTAQFRLGARANCLETSSWYLQAVDTQRESAKCWMTLDRRVPVNRPDIALVLLRAQLRAKCAQTE